MNERIRQLADEATSTLSMNHEGYRGKGYIEQVEYFDKEKFAELIVRECANQCDLLLDHKISSEWARGTHDCSKAIRKHFGVEE